MFDYTSSKVRAMKMEVDSTLSGHLRSEFAILKELNEQAVMPLSHVPHVYEYSEGSTD